MPLFHMFSVEGPLTLSWSNMPSKVDFKSSLEIDKWSKRSSKKSFKASFSFSSKGSQDIIELLPKTVKYLDVCPIPYIHPITYSKISKYEDLPDASGWNDDDAVMKVFGPNWCKVSPEKLYQAPLNRQSKISEKSLNLMIHMMRIYTYKRWCCVTCTWFLSLVATSLWMM